MDRHEAKTKFREADALYRQRRYPEALALLEELNAAHPGQHRVLYPMGRCLARLDRYDEAIDLLDRVASNFDYEPARALSARLAERTKNAAHIDFSSIDSGIGSGLDSPFSTIASKPPPLRDRAPGSSTRSTLILGGIVATVLIAAVGVQGTVGLPALEWIASFGDNPDEIPPAPVGSLVTFIVQALALGYLAGCVGGYLSLAAVQALPYTEFDDNLKDIALYVLFGSLLAFIPIVGWIVFLIMLYRHYELRFLTLVVAVFLYIVISSVLSYGLGTAVSLLAALVFV